MILQRNISFIITNFLKVTGTELLEPTHNLYPAWLPRNRQEKSDDNVICVNQD